MKSSLHQSPSSGESTLLNDNKEALTPGDLIQFPDCEHYTEKQALETIQSLEKLSAICYELLKNDKLHSIDSQQFVYLNLESQNIAA